MTGMMMEEEVDASKTELCAGSQARYCGQCMTYSLGGPSTRDDRQMHIPSDYGQTICLYG